MAKLPIPSDDRAARLAEVAQALGLPQEAFFSGIAAREPADALALLTLWSAITDSPGRNRVLSLARQEAARCGYDGTGEPVASDG